jgi:hypothetical protein
MPCNNHNSCLAFSDATTLHYCALLSATELRLATYVVAFKFVRPDEGTLECEIEVCRINVSRTSGDRYRL